MKFSILTPTYNHGEFLQDAIESVLRQDLPSEHIVADGGSSDNTISILESYDDRVTWLSRPDSGQSEALNRALNLASGDIIGWLNADEFYMPGALDRANQIFTMYPKLDVLVADSILADNTANAKRLYSSHRLSSRAIRGFDCYILTSSMFVRRRAVADFEFDKQLKVTMDWDFLLTLINRGASVRHLGIPLSVFRVYPSQASNRLRDLRDAEVGILARRHGVPLGASHTRHRVLGAFAHRMWKLIDGGYLREVKFFLKQRNSAMRWFAE